MLRRLACALGAVLLSSHATAQVDSWDVTWDQLAQLEGMEPGSPGVDALVAELSEVATLGKAPRADLLRARLARLHGREAERAGALLGRTSLALFTPRECWLLPEVVTSNEMAVHAVLRGLAGTPELSSPQLMLAWDTSLESVQGLRLVQGALPIHRVLHDRYQQAWSASALALTLLRLGDQAGVERVLGAAIAVEEAAGRPSADLWSERGIAAVGFGDEFAARDYLGQALARGSSDAALMLARIEMLAGHSAAARRTLRPSILTGSPSAWAARGWGLTLLPSPREGTP